MSLCALIAYRLSVPVSSRRPVVALALPPGEEFVAALDDAWRSGAAVLPMDPAAPPAVRDRLLDTLRPDLGVDDGIAVVIATSGSTGRPKGVELAHDALDASARATMTRLGQQDGDRWLACLPWHHIGGLQVLLRARLFATPLVVHERFDVERIRAERDVTLLSVVPTQLVRLLDAEVDLGRFRAVLLGGAMAPPPLLARAAACGANVVTTYGMSETSGGCVYDGLPLEGAAVRIGEEGRVQLSGPMLMSGYRLAPDLTAEVLEDGWFTTNDVGALAPDGRLVVRGRLDDVVVTGGENVLVTEVAGVLAGHPQVHEVVVTGVDDQHWGQRLVAVVVPRGEAPTLEALREWCRDRLPVAAAPRQLVLVTELPRLSSGKPDRLMAQSLAEGG
jgi:o-succinylbenzoate---CoA ligase